MAKEATGLIERASPRMVARRRATARAQRRLSDSTLTAYLMIAPMVGLLAVFVLWPLVYAVWLSGHRISFYQPSVWVGTQFYHFVLTDPRFWHSLRIGIGYAAMVVPTQMVLALLLASLIKAVSGPMAAVLKTTVYVPAVISSVVASVVFVFIYQDAGLANWVIGLLGMKPVAWLNDPSTALPAIAAPGVWLGFGIATLILLAAMLDIPQSYYESAALDGAGWFRTMRYITIPLLKNVFLFLFVTGFTLTVQEFQLPLIMTGGGPVDDTNTPNLFIFNSFRDGTPYATSFSLAASLLLFVVLGAISLIVFKLVRSTKAVDG
ncbi:MAG TPA: sugar ABC transporter permease [Gaiellaceae bacterium]|nr:sugar ABC transporter permease [Gaiellaceae bacterium]